MMDLNFHLNFQSTRKKNANTTKLLVMSLKPSLNRNVKKNFRDTMTYFVIVDMSEFIRFWIIGQKM